MIRWARRPTRGRILAVLCAVLMVLPAGLSASAGQTEASWVDSEHGQGNFTAKTVPVPTVTTCGVTALLGVVTSASVQFKAPNGTGYSYTDVKWSLGADPGNMKAADNPGPTISSPVSGEYTATFSNGLLTGLINALLGQGFYIAAYTGHPGDGGWTSPLVYSKVSVSVLNASCTVTP